MSALTIAQDRRCFPHLRIVGSCFSGKVEGLSSYRGALLLLSRLGLLGQGLLYCCRGAWGPVNQRSLICLFAVRRGGFPAVFVRALALRITQALMTRSVHRLFYRVRSSRRGLSRILFLRMSGE